MPPSETSNPTAAAEHPSGNGGGAAPYRVLARKYRPVTFSGLIGQEAMCRTLVNSLTSARLAHAFMLSGVRGIGKTTTARIIARALNCVGADGSGGLTPEPCGVCAHCISITADRHMDVIEMDAASRTGVDDIRELLDGTRYRPTAARYKIYIIDEVHMLSRNAFNALLKTLEEPPEHVRFVFATTEIRKVPITVLSRCQRFDLRRIDSDTLARHLAAIATCEGANVSEPALCLIARAADGSVRDGLSLLDLAIAHGRGSVDGDAVRALLGLADRTVIFDMLDAVVRGDIAPALELLDAQYNAGAEPEDMLGDMLDLIHWLTRIKVAASTADATGIAEAERVRGREMAAKLSLADATRLWQMLLKGLGEVRAAAAPLQAAAMVLIRAAYAARLPSPAEALGGERTERRANFGATEAVATGTGAVTGQTASATACRQRPAPQPAGGSGAPASSDAARRASAPGSVSLAQKADLNRYEVVDAHAPEPSSGQIARTLTSFSALVDLAREEREAILYGHLVADVRLVRFEPNRIEIRLTDAAPGDLVRRLGEFLYRHTAEPWFVTISHEEGAPTILEQRQRADAQRRSDIAIDPLVRAALAAFPNAVLGEISSIQRFDGAPDAEESPEETGEDERQDGYERREGLGHAPADPGAVTPDAG